MAVDDDLELGQARCASAGDPDIGTSLFRRPGRLPEDCLTAAPDAGDDELWAMATAGAFAYVRIAA